MGRYCGQVNLGVQCYKPMNFQVDVRYVDAETGNKNLDFASPLSSGLVERQASRKLI